MKFDKIMNEYMEKIAKADAEVVSESAGLTKAQPKDIIDDYASKNPKAKIGEPAKDKGEFAVDGFKALCFEMEGGDQVCAGECFKKYANSKGDATAGKPVGTDEMYKKVNAQYKSYPKGYKCGVCGKTP